MPASMLQPTPQAATACIPFISFPTAHSHVAPHSCTTITAACNQCSPAGCWLQILVREPYAVVQSFSKVLAPTAQELGYTALLEILSELQALGRWVAGGAAHRSLGTLGPQMLRCSPQLHHLASPLHDVWASQASGMPAAPGTPQAPPPPCCCSPPAGSQW